MTPLNSGPMAATGMDHPPYVLKIPSPLSQLFLSSQWTCPSNSYLEPFSFLTAPYFPVFLHAHLSMFPAQTLSSAD